MTISNEAVLAAAKAIMHAAFGQELPEAPDDLARAALEAAAPIIQAEAWDEGWLAVWTFMTSTDPRRERPTNPYRSRAVAEHGNRP